MHSMMEHCCLKDFSECHQLMNLTWNYLTSGREIHHHRSFEIDHHTLLFLMLILVLCNHYLDYQEIWHRCPLWDFFLQERKAELDRCPVNLFYQCFYRFYWHFLQFKRRDHNVYYEIENIHKLEDYSLKGYRNHSQNGCNTQWETCPCCCKPLALLWLRLALKARLLS